MNLYIQITAFCIVLSSIYPSFVDSEIWESTVCFRYLTSELVEVYALYPFRTKTRTAMKAVILKTKGA